MGYTTPEDLVNEGVSEIQFSDAHLQDRIDLASAAIDTITGRFFEKRTITLLINGNGKKEILLPVPPISSTTTLTVLVDETEVDPDDFFINMPSWPDGRFCPKLIRTVGVWTKGTANVSITGDFGFVDVVTVGQTTTYETPRMIKDLCKRISMFCMPKIGESGSNRSSQIIEEQLGDYRYKLAGAVQQGMFGDQLADATLSLFKRRIIGTLG